MSAELQDSGAAGRDYAAEMAGRLRAVAAGPGEWVAAVEAEKLAAELAERDPDLLDGWLHDIASDVIRIHLVRMANGTRSASRAGAKRRAFAAAAGEAEETGDYSSLLEVVHTVDDEQTRKRAADMTGADHRYVAHAYRQDAKTSRMLAMFHEAVAKKVGVRLTSEVFDTAEYEAMFVSLTGQAA